MVLKSKGHKKNLEPHFNYSVIKRTFKINKSFNDKRETGNLENLSDFPGGVWTHHPLWILAWAGGGSITDKSSDIFFILLSYKGDPIASMEGLNGDPYQYSYGNLEYL